MQITGTASGYDYAPIFHCAHPLDMLYYFQIQRTGRNSYVQRECLCPGGQPVLHPGSV